MYLYLGDDDASRAASYLCGIMLHAGLPFERVDSTQSPPDDFFSKRYDAYILSDYPRARFQPGQLERIRDAVKDGAGLLMIGGWESFHGMGGEYHKTVLAEVLPVVMSDKDDRCNLSQPALIYRNRDHEILEGLPWQRAPFVGGFNRLTAKPGAETLLKVICSDFRVVEEDQVADCNSSAICYIGGKPIEDRLSIPLPNGAALFLSLTESYPLLVVGRYGKGKTAALATDVAPHWVGGLIDWGRQRVRQDLTGGGFVEVGEDYAQFFAQLVRWTGTKDV